MKFEIRNRWTGVVQVTAEIECSEYASYGVKLGLAVKWAHERRAVLRRADLIGAVLIGADLSGADLSGAVLSGADLSGAVLIGADLIGADLSNADLSGADLIGAVLIGADLIGAVLRRAVLSGADLSRADLSGAVLIGADLSNAVLRRAVLIGADLSGADLSGAVLIGADLSGAVLSGADLSDAVLRDVPKIENIHRVIYEAASKPDALDMSTWHNSCGTAHCRAGWVVTLAGAAGTALESAIGTSAAAALIYLASDPTMERIPDFHCSDEDALADMKKLAEAGATS